VRIYISGAVAMLAIAAAIGCGSGDETTEVSLTKAQFVKQGDAICRSAQEKKTKAIQAWSMEDANKGKDLGDWSEEELSQVYLDLALPPIKEASDQLGELPAPEGDAKAEKLVKALAEAVESVEEKPTRAISEAPYASADKLAQAYGFKTCGLF
jgi:hypothetical protein